jgi:hypothetical protein
LIDIASFTQPSRLIHDVLPELTSVTFPGKYISIPTIKALLIPSANNEPESNINNRMNEQEKSLYGFFINVDGLFV